LDQNWLVQQNALISRLLLSMVDFNILDLTVEILRIPKMQKSI